MLLWQEAKGLAKNVLLAQHNRVNAWLISIVLLRKLLRPFVLLLLLMAAAGCRPEIKKFEVAIPGTPPAPEGSQNTQAYFLPKAGFFLLKRAYYAVFFFTASLPPNVPSSSPTISSALQHSSACDQPVFSWQPWASSAWFLVFAWPTALVGQRLF